MKWERLGTSPLGVVGLCSLAAATWTCSYRAAEGERPEGAIGDDASSGADVVELRASENGEQLAASAPSAAIATRAVQEGPRLVRPADPENPFGLPIAIDDGDGSSLAHFHRALARAARGEGQARIVFYGASHVASDLFTGYVRETLQQRYGDAGHGFVLPVHPWPRYRHRGVEVTSDRRNWESHRIQFGDRLVDYYGLAGVNVETNHAGAWGQVTTATSGEHGVAASLYDLYYLQQPNGGTLDVVIDGQRARRIHTAADRPSPGYATFDVPDGPHTFEIRARGDGPVRVFGVAVERDRPGVIVDTLGINGARARYQLLWNDELYREHLRRRAPDLVVLAYGTNESGDDDPIDDYEAALRRVVARVRETVPEASCLLVGPSDRPMRLADGVFEDRPRTGQIVDVQRRVARESGCGFYDLVAFQGGPLSMVEWVAADPPFASSDHVHYTRRGYERLGQTLLDAMLEGFQEPVIEPEGAAMARHREPRGTTSASQ